MKEMSQQYINELSKGNALERACAIALTDAIHGIGKAETIDKMLRLLADQRYSTMTLVYLDLTGNEWDTGELTQ